MSEKQWVSTIKSSRPCECSFRANCSATSCVKLPAERSNDRGESHNCSAGKRCTRGGRLWEHAFQGRPRVNPTVKRGKHGKRREPTCYEDTRPVAGADTGNRTQLYDMHRLEACLHLASYQLTMEHDLNCVRLMRSSAPFLARARPTASALEASSRSIRATHRRTQL